MHLKRLALESQYWLSDQRIIYLRGCRITGTLFFMNEQERKSIKPSIGKNYLFLIAGIMWFCVGLMLINFARAWLMEYKGEQSLLFIICGISTGLIIHHFGFLKIVDRNLVRIRPMNEKLCAFSFMSWKSYLLTIFMIALGIIFKSSSLPKHFLAVIYISIGLALALSSLRYFRVFLMQSRKKKN